MKRFNKYLKFRSEIKKLTKKMANMQSCPLGKGAISGYYMVERKFNKLNEKWQLIVIEGAERINRPYFTEGEQGYSEYDLDQAMMYNTSN